MRALDRSSRAATRRVAIALSLAGASHAAACAHVPAPAPAHAIARRLALDEVRFASASGSTISAWFAAGRPGRGAVLLLHGVGASRKQMLGRAEFLSRAGLAVLLPDFRAHGASTGARTTYGALESLDAAAALAYLRARACGERVGVVGISMGGAATLLGPGPLETDAVVLESVYPTIRDATRDRLDAWLGPLGFVGRLATPLALRVNGWRIGVGEEALRPIERIGAVKAPLLLLSGTHDPYTRLPETRALYARATAPKELWLLEGARHEDLYGFAGAEYERRVGGFLVRHLAASGVGPDASPVAPSGAALGSAEPEERAGAGQAPQCLEQGERQGER